MKIDFEHVLPVPLSDTPLSEDSCWKKDFSFDTNSILLAEAASGTGKTTLVSMLYGIRHDYDGKIKLDGEDIRNFPLRQWSQLRRKKFSIVFQDLRLFPQLTAKENIILKNDLESTLKEEEIIHYAAILGVQHRLGQVCGKLSLGQQQRVAIIRALAQPFDFLLLDEPFSHLDETNARTAARLIMEKCIQNKAGLLLTSLGPNDFFNYTGTIII